MVPAVLLVLALCLGAVQVAGQQVRLTGAAAAAARSLARGDSEAAAAGLVARLVGPAAISTEQQGDFVCVRLSAPSAFGALAAFGITVSAGSCALGAGA